MQHYSVSAIRFHENPFLLCVNPPICKAFPGNTFKRIVSTLRISHAKRSTIIEPEIELSHIPLEMVLANMVIRPDQAALQDIKETLGTVDVRNPASVFLITMIDGGMLREFFANIDIGSSFIGHKMRVLRNLTAQDGREVLGINTRYVETAR